MTRAIAGPMGRRAGVAGWHLGNGASWYLCDEPSLPIVQSAQAIDPLGCAIEPPHQGSVNLQSNSSKPT